MEISRSAFRNFKVGQLTMHHPSPMKTLLVALLFAGCAAAVPTGMPEVSVTWDHAVKYVPSKQSPPVVIFLHGCAGITPENRNWGRIMRGAGFMVIMPDSFARPGRISGCDPRTFGYDANSWSMISRKRVEEMRYALAMVHEMHPPKIIVMGHSEGAVVLQNLIEVEADAYIPSGTSCKQLHLPEKPLLILRFSSDPWERVQGPDKCGDRPSTRINTTLHLLPGQGHDPSYDRGTQKTSVDT
jgi:dienelactone hydrolase